MCCGIMKNEEAIGIEWSEEMAIQYCSENYGTIYTKMYHESHAGAYVSYLRGERCQTDESFFAEISASFQFPGYFGNNWNALHDCLSNLGWLKFTKIFIAFDDFEIVFRGDEEGKRLLSSAFTNMVKWWSEQGIEVEVWLNDRYRYSG